LAANLASELQLFFPALAHTTNHVPPASASTTPPSLDPMAFVQDSSPSTLAKFIATAFVAGVGGYFIGLGSSIGVFGGPATKQVAAAESSDEEAESDDDSNDGELQQFSGTNEECKLVLVVRTDLGMTKGKQLCCRICHRLPPNDCYRRQDRSSMLACNPCMLQDFPRQVA
jgi:hypothetical protein